MYHLIAFVVALALVAYFSNALARKRISAGQYVVFFIASVISAWIWPWWLAVIVFLILPVVLFYKLILKPGAKLFAEAAEESYYEYRENKDKRS